MTGREARLEDRGVKHSNLKTGAPHDREAHQPVASSHDRGHDVRKFSEKTQHDYIRHVENFAKFLGRSPDTATGEDLRRYQVHQTENGVQPPSVNSSAVALRFLFTVTLGRANLATQLTRVHYPRRLPRVLSPEDVGRLLEAAPGPGPQVQGGAERCLWGRAARVRGRLLKVSDIDSKRMLIRVEQGKGRKDRHAMLSPQLLEVLRAWWRQCRSQGWLFPGRDPFLPITTRQLNRACHMAAEVAGLGPGSRRIRCGTASRRIFWRATPTCVSSRFCSDMRSWIRPRAMPRSPPTCCGRSPARSIDLTSAEGWSRRRNAPLPWPGHRWRSRTSSATMGPLGVTPTAATSASAN